MNFELLEEVGTGPGQVLDGQWARPFKHVKGVEELLGWPAESPLPVGGILVMGDTATVRWPDSAASNSLARFATVLFFGDASPEDRPPGTIRAQEVVLGVDHDQGRLRLVENEFGIREDLVGLSNGTHNPVSPPPWMYRSSRNVCQRTVQADPGPGGPESDVVSAGVIPHHERPGDPLANSCSVSPSGNTSLNRPVLTSNTNPRIGTSGEIHGCDLAFWICSRVFFSGSVKLKNRDGAIGDRPVSLRSRSSSSLSVNHEHPAVGVIDNHDLSCAQQPGRESKRPDRVVIDHGAEVSDHVDIGIRETQHLPDVG